MISLDFNDAVFSGGQIGPARPTLLLQFGSELFQKNFVLGKTIDHGDGFSPTTVFFDPKHGNEFITLWIDFGLTGALGYDLFAFRAFAIQLGIRRVNQAGGFRIHSCFLYAGITTSKTALIKAGDHGR